MEDTLIVSPSTAAARTRKRPWLAALLSLLTPGLGHAYLGFPWRGLFFYLGSAWCVLSAYSAIVRFPIPAGLVVFGVVTTVTAAFVAADAWRCAKSAGRHPFGRFDRWYTYVVLAVLAAVLGSNLPPVLRTRVRAFHIPAASMEPALLVGDRCLVDMRAYDRAPPSRGDAVVFLFPEDPDKIFVKRVIGLPGERVEIRAKHVMIDGEQLDEPYARFVEGEQPASTASPRDNLEATVIPEHQYFVMGDNRDLSYDSRFFGPVAEEAILGKVHSLYYSADADGGVRWERIGAAVE